MRNLGFGAVMPAVMSLLSVMTRSLPHGGGVFEPTPAPTFRFQVRQHVPRNCPGIADANKPALQQSALDRSANLPVCQAQLGSGFTSADVALFVHGHALPVFAH